MLRRPFTVMRPSCKRAVLVLILIQFVRRPTYFCMNQLLSKPTPTGNKVTPPFSQNLAGRRPHPIRCHCLEESSQRSARARGRGMRPWRKQSRWLSLGHPLRRSAAAPAAEIAVVRVRVSKGSGGRRMSGGVPQGSDGGRGVAGPRANESAVVAAGRETASTFSRLAGRRSEGCRRQVRTVYAQRDNTFTQPCLVWKG